MKYFYEEYRTARVLLWECSWIVCIPLEFLSFLKIEIAFLQSLSCDYACKFLIRSWFFYINEFSQIRFLCFLKIISFFIIIKLIYFNWSLITIQYCSGFWHTLTWISHGFTCVSHPEPPPTSLLISSLWVIPVHQPWAPCLMHRTWTGELFHIW